MSSSEVNDDNDWISAKTVLLWSLSRLAGVVADFTTIIDGIPDIADRQAVKLKIAEAFESIHAAADLIDPNLKKAKKEKGLGLQ